MPVEYQPDRADEFIAATKATIRYVAARPVLKQDKRAVLAAAVQAQCAADYLRGSGPARSPRRAEISIIR